MKRWGLVAWMVAVLALVFVTASVAEFDLDPSVPICRSTP